MANENGTSEELARQVFILTMIGTAAFISAVVLFIL